MSRRTVPAISGLEETVALLELISNADKYRAQVKELSDLIAEANKAVEAEDLAGDISALKIQAQTDRQMAKEELANARRDSGALKESTTIALKAEWKALEETHRQLDRTRTEHEQHMKDWESDIVASVASLNEREKTLEVREANLTVMAADVAKRDKDLKALEMKFKQAKELLS